MKLINDFLNLFPHADKVAHFILGFAVTLFSYWIFKLDPWVCFGLGMTAGLAKEMGWDYVFKGHVSWWDWFATIFGSFIATCIIL